MINVMWEWNLIFVMQKLQYTINFLYLFLNSMTRKFITKPELEKIYTIATNPTLAELISQIRKKVYDDSGSSRVLRTYFKWLKKVQEFYKAFN